MRNILAILVFGMCLATARGEEPPHLDFVRKLRESHYPDLALEYLEKLVKIAPAEMRPSIELEIARSRLDIARSEPDSGKRPALFAQARAAFEAIVQSNPNSAQASEAKLAITDIAVIQGRTLLQKAQLQKAVRQQASARQAEALKARAALDDAAKQLEIGIKELEAKLAKYDETNGDQEARDKKALQETKLKAQLERGIVLLEEAETFSPSESIEAGQQRSEIVKQARAVLDKTAAATDAQNPIHWQARAWVAKCIYEDGDLSTARTRLEAISKIPAAGPNKRAIEAGHRLAIYFLMQVVPEAALPKEDTAREQYRLGQLWTKSFPQDFDTPEGRAVRFLLGKVCISLAQALDKDKTKRAQANEFFTEAEKLFKGLEQSENEYTDVARQTRINLIFTRSGEGKTAIKNLLTFDACYIRAIYEAGQMESDAKETKDPSELEKKHKQRNENIIAALKLGLKYAENKRPRPPEKDVDTATAMLVYSDLTSGNYPEAIALGEKMVRERPLSPQAAAVAMYTLQAYSQILGTDGKLKEEEEEQYRAKMEALAKYALNRWPNDAAADLAHFQMGLMAIRDKRYPEAVEELAKVRSTFGAAIHAQYHLAMTAFQVAKDKAAEKEKAPAADRERLDKEEQAYKSRAVGALESLPGLPPGADPATNQLYIYAKVRLGQHLYTQKKYAEMERLAGPLLERLPQMRLADESAREQAQSSLVLLKLYAAYGKASDEIAAGRPAQARESVDRIVEQFKAGSLPELKKDPQLRGAVLGLALRASLQEGKLDRARDVLKVMQSAADNPQEAGVRAVLPLLTNLMKEEMARVRKTGDKAALEKTTAGLTAFLDELAKGQTDHSPQFTLALARSYSDLDQFAKVIELASKIEEPKSNETDQRPVQIYRAARVLLLRAYRLNDQLSEAEKVLKEIYASWGKTNLEVQFERIHLMEANKKFGAAATEWNKLLKQLQTRVHEPDMKSRYFECYFHLVRSLYLHGIASKESKYIKQAAGLMIKLENAWPDFGGEASETRFREFLAQEKELSEQYNQQKNQQKAAK